MVKFYKFQDLIIDFMIIIFFYEEQQMNFL